ncbi:MAG: biotin--[acetyl-CoA-carboxylase] ligase [Bacteroidetes bacterium]|nr:biotin--[acetyl-CoA-carboxylase] ligase [Bacteroidota bacterium]
MPGDGFLKILDTVDSTNNYAMGMIREGLATHAMAFAAKEQTAGKGQRGKTWQAQAGKNIALSVVIKTDWLKPDQQFLLSMLVALGANDFLKKYIPAETSIKWPNDLYWRDRKAGGILIETVFKGTIWNWAVAGIGINVNQERFHRLLPNPVSMKQVCDREFDVTKLTHELYAAVMKRVEEGRNVTPQNILAAYNQLLYRRNQQVRLKRGTVTFTTTVKNVTLLGQLHTTDAIDRHFDFGDVVWLL